MASPRDRGSNTIDPARDPVADASSDPVARAPGDPVARARSVAETLRAAGNRIEAERALPPTSSPRSTRRNCSG